MLSGDDMVNSSGVDFIMYAEAGLLGIVFDPAFETTKRFWINYDKGTNHTASILGFKMTDPDTVDVTSGTELFNVAQPNFNHKGGMMEFGHDGCLYIGMGDGGGEGDPSSTGQGTNDQLAVMLRVDVDRYPMAAPGNLAGNIWSTGLRNPWRWSFDRLTGDMYIGEIGQDAGSGFEEINVEPRGAMGRNYGWSTAEGSTVCKGDCTGMSTPAVEYPTTDGANSVIGGYVYRGKAMPEMVGRYVYADWTERKIKTFIYKGETGGQAEVCDEFDTGVTVGQKVRAFGQDLDGELYVMSGGSGTGLSGASPTSKGYLYKIEPM
jgi:glucose/arabinose dehydrogenase